MPGRGIVASFGVRFWVLVALVGVGAGIAGGALIELLRLVQHAAWSYHSGEFLTAVERSSDARRVLVLLLGGFVAGAGVVVLTRLGRGGEVSESIWLQGARLPLWPSLARAVHSIVVVALGASLGREAAPQQAGAALASTLSQRARLPDWQRRLLVACGAGAGMAAVYNVPLGGALFALEVLLGTLTLPLVLPALATTLIATAVAWIVLPAPRPTRSRPISVHACEIVWALIVGPLAGLVSVRYVRMIARRTAAAGGMVRVLVPVVVFTALGAVAIPYPQLLGNGKNVVQLALVGQLGVGAARRSARAQAARHGRLPRQRRARRAVHANARAAACCSAGCSGTAGRNCGPARRSAATRSSAAPQCSARRCRGRSPPSC